MSTSHKQVKWQSKKLAIPKSAVNFALLANGSTATASSCDNGFKPSGVINGCKDVQSWGTGNGWKSSPVSWHPNWWGEWVQISFSEEREIDTIVVYSFPQMVAGRLWGNLLHYQVQYRDGSGDWVTIKSIRNNRDDYNVVSFSKLSTDTLRVYVNRNHYREETGFESSCAGTDESPRILEIEAYLLHGSPIICDIQGSKTVECGENGSIAIFADIAFAEKPSIDLEKMTNLLRKWKYGVTWLDADDLCIKEVFNQRHFDIFIHPYGAFIPTGTYLYDYLLAGGHMITFGGRAFTAAKQKIDGVWKDVGMDPGITVSKARYIDYMRPYREQLGMFTVPGSTLEHVVRAETNKNQSITQNAINHVETVNGWMSLGVVGELLALDESRQYALEGRMPEINHLVREGINRAKSDTPLLWGENQDENYGSVFSYPCARWISLIDGYDEHHRNRGPIAAFMPHYEGVYRGSHWAFFGVEEVDVMQWDQMDQVIFDILRYMRYGVVAHSLEPAYSCFRQGESVDFSIIVDNMSPANRNIRLEFTICDCSSNNECVYRHDEPFNLGPGWKRLDLAWKPEHLPGDFYKITAKVFVDEQEIDCLENGFTVWDDGIIASGAQVEFVDNYFHFDGSPRYVTGARDSGLHMPWQPEENTLRWEKQYKMLRDYGMQMTSPVHLDWCIPGLGWGEFREAEPIPEILMRRMDAQVQIAQKNKLIYAPCIFFTYENIAMQKPEIAGKICEALGKRYKQVPGIIFYIFDDGLRHDPVKFNEWAKVCIDGFNACGRTYMVTAEMGFRQIWPDAMRRSAKHLTFSSGSVFQQSVGDPVYERIIDLRPAGKSFTMGEFVRRIPMGTSEDFHGYLAPIHVNFGMGNAMGLNWKWATPYHTIWPSDVVFPGNNVPKQHLFAYRNAALFFRLFQPIYKSPDLIMVMPSAFWLKNSEAVTRYMVNLIRRLLEMKVDFACIDDDDLEMLPVNTSALLLPIPLELSTDAYTRIRDYAVHGGQVFVIGDLGGQNAQTEGDSSPEWLDELCGIEYLGHSYESMKKGHSLFMDQYMEHHPVNSLSDHYIASSWIRIRPVRASVVLQAADGTPIMTRANIGKGCAWFMNDLGTDFIPAVFDGFFEEAGIHRLSLKPDLASLHCFKVDTCAKPVYTLFTFPWDTGRQEIILETDAGAVEMVLKDQSMGVVSISGNGRGIGALETQGRVTLDGCEILDTDAHLMVAALDNANIPDSSAFIVFPVSTGRFRIKTRLVDTIESGEIIGGKWTAYACVHFKKQAGAHEIDFEMNDSSVLYLACKSDERRAAVERLESILY